MRDGIRPAPCLRGRRSCPCSPGWSSRGRGGSGAPQGCAWARRQEETTDFLRSAGSAARPRGLWFVHLQAAAPNSPAGNNGPSVTCRESGMCLSLWAACLLPGQGHVPAPAHWKGPSVGLSREGRVSQRCWDGALAWAKGLSQLLLPAERGLQQGQGLFPSLPDTAPGAVSAL